ncbi:MAG: glycosyltransferase family 4 protein [Kangiellaceae bacterium]|jgi:glycosyltransferase involved in cell wall biosynthesis|nr:glycosyltransferase family 4 protein [Kangiellaceae bacterium]
MNVVLLSSDFYPNIGGVAAHVLELAKALKALGHKVIIVAQNHSKHRHAEELFGLMVLRPSFKTSSAFYGTRLRRYLLKVVDKYNVDIIHVHTIRALPATKNLSLPIIFTNHTSTFLRKVSGSKYQQRRILRKLQHCQAIIAPSQILINKTRAIGFSGKLLFQPNGVDIDRFYPKASEQLSSTVFLFAGRFVTVKGPKVLADAIKLLGAANYRVIFVGEGEELADVKLILSDEIYQERCEYLGYISNEKMPHVYHRATVTVLPSFMEATSITGLEAMASGHALIGSKVGGIPVLIEHDVNGFLVTPGDHVELAEKLRKLIDEHELVRKMAHASRAKAETQFSWRLVASNVVDIYSTVLEEG